MGSIAARSLIISLLFVSILGVCSGCEKKRPPGFLSVGKIAEVAAKTQFLPDYDVYIRRDERGISIMSTLCSVDLSKLHLEDKDGKQVLASEYTTSLYDLEGHVLNGPAEKDLSFYAGRIDSGEYGGPKDTLYVDFATEVDRNWRLPIP